jgi:ribosome-associated protein
MTEKKKDTSTLDMAIICAQLADEKKAEEIVIMDMRELSVVTDFFVVCTVQSKPQMKALMSALSVMMRNSAKRKFGVEGLDGASWVLCDYGDVIVHIFSPTARKYYDLEILWGDAPKIDWHSAAAK